MIKRIAAALATLGLATFALAAASPASARASTALIPRNWWPPEVVQYFHNENWKSDCARIDSSNALIIGTGDCTPFYAFGTFGNYTELRHNISSTSFECLYFDQTGARDYGQLNSYDLGSCNQTVASDLWFSSSTNTWSEWSTQFNSKSGNAMWATGTGTSHPLTAAPANGKNNQDHWQAESS